MLSVRDLLRSRDTNRLKVKGWKKIFLAYSNKKNWVAILTWDKIDFKLKSVIRDKRHYIMTKRSIHQEDITIINIYTNNRSQKYMKETLACWMDTKTRPIYMLSTRDPLQTWGHTQTQSEGMEKGISWKWKPKESRSGYTYT